ncbi:MAG: RNA polymerase sigma factor [Salibacteraceae bacterium]
MLNKELNNLSEAKLLDLFYKEKNDKALGALFNSYLPFVFATCVYYLKDRAKAKDATSDVLEKMLKYFRKKEVTNAKALILISAKNYCLTLLKKEKNLVDIDVVQHRLAEENQLDDKIKKEADLNQLESALSALKKEQEQCVRMFYLQKMSYQQIENETNYNLKQVKSNIQNGKRMLRNLLLEKMNHGNE